MKRSLALAALALVVALACGGEKKRERVGEEEAKESSSATASSSVASTGEPKLEGDDLALGSASANPSAPSSSALGGKGDPPSAAVLAGVNAKGGDTYELAQVTIDWIFEYGMRSLASASNGRVNRVAPGSLGEKLGFKSGDIVKTIDGFDITDPESVLDAYMKLRKANRAEVVLERDGKKVVLTYVRSGS